MSPLFLVDWHSVNERFRALMWVIAVVLALAILISAAPTSARRTEPRQRGMSALAPAHTNKP